MLFFVLSNFFYWYFNRTFLYAELMGDTGYLIYEWLGNALTTVTMAILLFCIEFCRSFFGRGRTR
jgi:hypothetical protein